MSIPVITQIEWHAEVEVRYPDVEYHVDERNEDVIVATVQGIEVGRYVPILGQFYAWVRASRIDSIKTVMNDRIEWN